MKVEITEQGIEKLASVLPKESVEFNTVCKIILQRIVLQTKKLKGINIFLEYEEENSKEIGIATWNGEGYMKISIIEDHVEVSAFDIKGYGGPYFKYSGLGIFVKLSFVRKNVADDFIKEDILRHGKMVYKYINDKECTEWIDNTALRFLGKRAQDEGNWLIRKIKDAWENLHEYISLKLIG